jgi:hypothetical protein
MPIDLTSLRKLEGAPASAAAAPLEGIVRVLIKLREGFAHPAYLKPRAHYGPSIFSADIPAEQLPRLESDGAIETVSLSQRLDRID